ncbi:MAG: prolyl-tRNA synthetase associated domain-containing protein [Clostridiales bacterium]|nr:prolyl-tRNA synthetase associated domain-containing protein [Clostridiales bacterium]
MKSDAQTVFDVLNNLSINFEHLAHEPVFSMDDCKTLSLTLKAPFCKNLFLQNRQGTEFFLLLIREDKRFRTAEVSKKIDRARLSFGNDDKLYEFLGLYPGAISPMGLIHDKNHIINLLIDKDLLQEERLCFHACVNTQSIAMHVCDFINIFLSYTGHTPQVIEISGE